MNIYRNCDVLPLYNFKKLKDDLRWLIKDWDGYEDLHIKEDLNSLKSNIENEFIDKLDSIEIKQTYRKREKLRKMKLEYTTCSLIINSYRKDMLISHVERLSSCLQVFGFKYKINTLKSIDKEIKRIKSKLSSLKFNIDMLESEITIPTEIKEVDVFEEVANLEKATNRSEINPFTTTVSRYIAILKEARTNVR